VKLVTESACSESGFVAFTGLEGCPLLFLEDLLVPKWDLRDIVDPGHCGAIALGDDDLSRTGLFRPNTLISTSGDFAA